MKPSIQISGEQLATTLSMVAVTALGALSAPGHLLVLAIVLLFAVLSATSALVAAFWLLLLKSLSSGLTGEHSELGPLFWAALILLFLRVFVSGSWSATSRHVPLARVLTVFLISALLSSAVSSSYFLVSLLKIFTFGLVSLSVINAVATMRTALTKLRVAMLGFWGCCLLLSFASVLQPSISFARDGVGFQGILNHPQALGVVLAPLAGFLAAGALSVPRARWMYAALLIATFSLMLMTRARTGIFAIMLGCLLVWLIRSGTADRTTRRFWALGMEYRIKIEQVALVVCLPTLAILAIALVGDFGMDFVFKSSESNDIGEAFVASRGFLMLQAIENFLNNPIFGIGFGIAQSDTHAFSVEQTGLIPMGAPTEKANLILAVLEEVGLVGFLAFVPFLVVLVRTLCNCSDLRFAVAATTALCTNIGEMTFFSMGGYGLYLWLVFACAFPTKQQLVPKYSSAHNLQHSSS